MKKLNSVAEVDAEALAKGPVRLAILSPGDPSFMQAIKAAYEKNLITPVLVGKKELMQKVAAEIDFDISAFEQIYLENPQPIADKGAELLSTGEVDAISKGQMSTNFVYRAVIRKMKQEGQQQMIAVTSFWEISPLEDFVILTDPGVNIWPDRDTKVELAKKAIHYLGLFGHDDPRIMLLSARREISRELPSHTDADYLKKVLADEGYSCPVGSGNFKDLFEAEPDRRPNILLMPHLVTGNSVVKLDFLMDVKRRGIIMTSWGPVLIPARADSATHLLNEITLAVTVACRFKEGYHENFC